MTPRLRPWHWLLLGLIVVIGAGLFVAPRQLTTGPAWAGEVSSALAEWSGGTVTPTEPLSIRYLPPLSLRGGFKITNATKLPSVQTIDAPEVKISLDLIELLMGRTQFAALQLNAPTFTLREEDDAGTAASGPSASFAEAVAKTPG